jgi:hypothetical protein
MSQQYNAIAIQEGGRLDLALQVYKIRQYKSLQCTTAAFNVKHQRLSDQLHKITSQSPT